MHTGALGARCLNHHCAGGDDQTMGTVLVARMAPLFKRVDYAAEVTRQQIGFADRLRDPKDGLNYHGYNDKSGWVRKKPR